MRESIGGAWLFGIVITFIFMFSGFLAYSISYTKAFNVKNEVVNIIEQSLGIKDYGTDYDNVTLDDNYDYKNKPKAKIIRLVRETGYNTEAANRVECKNGNMRGYKLGDSGVCIIKYCSIGSPSDTGDDQTLRRTTDVHYKVTSYIAFQLPVVNAVFDIPISGETTTFSKDNGEYPCGDENVGSWSGY